MWPFSKRVEAHATTVPEMISYVRQLATRLDELQEAHERLRAQHLSLRGRVYAIWGREGSSEDDAVPAAASPAPAMGETKEQFRQRMAAAGLLKPGKKSN